MYINGNSPCQCRDCWDSSNVVVVVCYLKPNGDCRFKAAAAAPAADEGRTAALQHVVCLL